MKIEKYFDKTYAYFYKRINNREDVEDETMILMQKLYKRLEKGKIDDPYFYKMCKNQLIDYYKKRQKTWDNETDFGILEQKINTFYPSQNYKADIEILKGNVEKILKEPDKSILKNIYFDGFNYSEIAEKFGKSEATLRKIVSRSIQKLKQYYRVI